MYLLVTLQVPGTHYRLTMKVKVLVAQSRPTLRHPIDCSLPGCSVYRILQARILEWVAMPLVKSSGP